MVNGHKSAARTDLPDGGTGKMCLGGGMHCPSASSFFSIKLENYRKHSYPHLLFLNEIHCIHSMVLQQSSTSTLVYFCDCLPICDLEMFLLKRKANTP